MTFTSNHWARPIPVQIAFDAIVTAFGIPEEQLTISSRQHRLVRARWGLMYLLRTKFKLPFMEIGEYLTLDSSTAQNACTKFARLIDDDLHEPMYTMMYREAERMFDINLRQWQTNNEISQ